MELGNWTPSGFSHRSAPTALCLEAVLPLSVTLPACEMGLLAEMCLFFFFSEMCFSQLAGHRGHRQLLMNWIPLPWLTQTECPGCSPGVCAMFLQGSLEKGLIPGLGQGTCKTSPECLSGTNREQGSA